MPRKKSDTAAPNQAKQSQTTILRQSAEQKYADELNRLKESDKHPKPAG